VSGIEATADCTFDHLAFYSLAGLHRIETRRGFALQVGKDFANLTVTLQQLVVIETAEFDLKVDFFITHIKLLGDRARLGAGKGKPSRPEGDRKALGLPADGLREA
jgi:hypothetical protein